MRSIIFGYMELCSNWQRQEGAIRVAFNKAISSRIRPINEQILLGYTRVESMCMSNVFVVF